MTYQAGIASPHRAFHDEITSGSVQTGTNKADVNFGLLAARAIEAEMAKGGWSRRYSDIAAGAHNQAMGPRERSPIDSITG
jgi:hypothetical protein